MRSIRTIATAVALAALMALAAPAAAQTTTLLDDPLTEPGGAFDEDSGGDVAVLEFNQGGMTVAAVNRGKGLYLAPLMDAAEDALLSAAIEVDVTTGNKKTGVGLFCRRSDANGGYLFYVRGKKWTVFGRDDFNELTKLEDGKVKRLDLRKGVTLRADCERETPTSNSAVLTFEIDGKEVVSFLEASTPLLGTVGLYAEGVGKGSALATFSDLTVEQLPAGS